MVDINKAYRIVSEKLVNWVQEFIRLLPNIFLAAIVLVLGLFVARRLRVILDRLFHRMFHNQAISSLCTSIVYVFLVGITLFWNCNSEADKRLSCDFLFV